MVVRWRAVRRGRREARDRRAPDESRIEVDIEAASTDTGDVQRDAHLRDEFGVNWNQAVETGGFLVGRDVQIELDIEAVRQG
jgi:polyisoprenoid-binding protein YceI